MSERYEFIDVEKATRDGHGRPRYRTRQMCEWLEVSTSGCYEWLDRPASTTVVRREWLKLLIGEIFDASDGTYGYRRAIFMAARSQLIEPDAIFHFDRGSK